MAQLPPAVPPLPPPQLQVMTSGTNKDGSPLADISIPPSLYPPDTRKGDLIAIRPLHIGKGKAKDQPLLFKVDHEVEEETTAGGSRTATAGQQRMAPLPPFAKTAFVTVASSVQASFPWAMNRVEVSLSLIDSPTPTQHVASYVELYFHNVYLGRPDQFRLALSLVDTTLFLEQKLTVRGARLRVGALGNQHGKKVKSAYIDGETKIIYRSESARCFILVEVSEEMWHFEEDGSTLREKCEVFLTELFSRFEDSEQKTYHTVSIILYGRVLYDDNGEGDEERVPLQRTEDGVLYRDFYKVILDLTLKPPASMARTVAIEIRRWEQLVYLRTTTTGQQKLSGRIAFAHESNVLEALNLTLNTFEEHWIDRDLQRTGLAVLVLTAGTSFYQVDKTLLRLTTERMLFHGVGADVISLSKAPLHTVPLFSFKSHEPGLSEGVSMSSPRNNTLGMDGLPSLSSSRPTREQMAQDALRTAPTFPDDQRDPLYYDAPSRAQQAKSEYFAEPLFVFCSFFGFQIDKPHRIDRFMPRARCYYLFAQGIGQRVPIAIPLLPTGTEAEREDESWSFLSEQEKRQARRDKHDALAVGAKADAGQFSGWSRDSGAATSGTSNESLSRFNASGSDGVRVPAQAVPIQPRKRDVAAKRTSTFATDHTNPAHSRTVSAAARPSTTATAAITIGEPEQRGRARAVSDVRIPSSTRSRTPVGRPQPNARSPSVSSVRTISTRAPGLLSKTSATPALISRLNKHQQQSSASSTAGAPASTASTRSGGWFGAFRSLAQSATTSPAPSVSVQRVEAFSDNVRHDLESDAISTFSSDRRSSVTPSLHEASPASTSRALPAVQQPSRPAPAKPISIGSRAPQTRDLDRISAKAHSGSLEHKRYAPILSATRSPRGGQVSKFNPSKPGKRSVALADQARRWASIFLRRSNDQRAVNWTSITRGACLPLTTDYLPSAEALLSQFVEHGYSISTTSTASSFLLLSGESKLSPIRELVTELVSQRLAQGFQICTPANALGALDELNLPSDKTVTDVLQDIDEGKSTAVFLSLATQIHRIEYNRRTGDVDVKISTRKSSWKKPSFDYCALVWTQNSDHFSYTNFHCPFPKLLDTTEWQHLDLLVAGVDKPDLLTTPRFWRTRLVLIPAESIPEREYLVRTTAAFEGADVTDEDIHYQGFLTLMDNLQSLRWLPPGVERERIDVENTQLTAPEWAADVANKIANQAIEPAPSSGPSVPHNKTKSWLPLITSMASSRNVPTVSSSSSPAEVGSVAEPSDKARSPSPPSRSSDSPTQPKRPSVSMAFTVVLDLDPIKTSDRAERVLCHFDRSHNPRAAYHIELTWLSGSGKIIDNRIGKWTRDVAKFGLCLVEVSTRPVESRHNPFQQATHQPLALAPPQLDPAAGVHRHYYEMGLLTSLGFILDIGADDTFPSHVDVQYSYRRAPTETSQFIHRSGTLLVSILGGLEGFSFVPNRIYISHAHNHSQTMVSPEEPIRQLQKLCGDKEKLMVLWSSLRDSLPVQEA